MDVEILDASGVHRRNGRFYQEGGETWEQGLGWAVAFTPIQCLSAVAVKETRRQETKEQGEQVHGDMKPPLIFWKLQVVQ